MRYIAKRYKKDYQISGLQEMKTAEGKTVEVIIDTKIYEKQALLNNLKTLEEEKAQYLLQYDMTIKDLNDMLQAISDIK